MTILDLLACPKCLYPLGDHHLNMGVLVRESIKDVAEKCILSVGQLEARYGDMEFNKLAYNPKQPIFRLDTSLDAQTIKAVLIEGKPKLDAAIKLGWKEVSVILRMRE